MMKYLKCNETLLNHEEIKIKLLFFQLELAVVLPLQLKSLKLQRNGSQESEQSNLCEASDSSYFCLFLKLNQS